MKDYRPTEPYVCRFCGYHCGSCLFCNCLELRDRWAGVLMAQALMGERLSAENDDTGDAVIYGDEEVAVWAYDRAEVLLRERARRMRQEREERRDVKGEGGAPDV